MKKTMLVAIVAGFAMISTTGLVALATAAPQPELAGAQAQAQAEAELVAHLDSVLAGQLAQIKSRLQP